jgi:hypothetical protein
MRAATSARIIGERMPNRQAFARDTGPSATIRSQAENVVVSSPDDRFVFRSIDNIQSTLKTPISRITVLFAASVTG